MQKKFKFAGTLLTLLLAVILQADDAEAAKAYQKGLDQIKEKKYYAALKSFKDSELQAKSNTIRANSVLAQIGAAKLAGLPWREFELIETLLKNYPEFADVPASVKREFELGDLYFQGKREPAFYAMRSIPWLTGPDKTAEIYSAALKRAPYSSHAPSAHLRLAFIYDQRGEVAKSLNELRIVEQKFPDSSSYKLALLALSYGCYELAMRGDGDGRYAMECAELSAKFLKKYPGDPSTVMVKRNLQRIRDVQARRLYDMAEFYRRQGRKEAAGRYLARVVREYPETVIAPASEKELANFDKSFVPGDFPAGAGPRFERYKAAMLPQEAERVLLFPEENGKHNLLPVPDLKVYMNKEEVKK